MAIKKSRRIAIGGWFSNALSVMTRGWFGLIVSPSITETVDLDGELDKTVSLFGSQVLACSLEGQGQAVESLVASYVLTAALLGNKSDVSLLGALVTDETVQGEIESVSLKGEQADIALQGEQADIALSATDSDESLSGTKDTDINLRGQP